ncbi:hypothetical protein Tter_1786 [Thermobaculum terrenum ATCC BAA-798]|uniref:Uncharacterized protein n=1 Tax=Thermobaculum terrenum (strain ATCC BAA-798 / CCMEE 7001 / YNP1) TaxID=525904 RepID=D1CD27_THET1|nr:hypothetical protein Tter_1786 [Thermobaculum terrenum ATCC BAA-798]
MVWGWDWDGEGWWPAEVVGGQGAHPCWREGRLDVRGLDKGWVMEDREGLGKGVECAMRGGREWHYGKFPISRFLSNREIGNCFGGVRRERGAWGLGAGGDPALRSN